MDCPTCGQSTRLDARFCTNCGQRLIHTDTVPHQHRGGKSRPTAATPAAPVERSRAFGDEGVASAASTGRQKSLPSATVTIAVSTTSEKQHAQGLIRATLDQLKQVVSGAKPPNLNESDTKANFIEKYLEALGYSGLADVTREYYVKHSQEFIDYVIKGVNGPLLAWEAKALPQDLTEKAAAQLVQYCAVEGIEWGVLTNGRELRLYNQYVKGALETKLSFTLDLVAYTSDEEYEAIFEQLWILSKKSMTTPPEESLIPPSDERVSAPRMTNPDAILEHLRALGRALDDAHYARQPLDDLAWQLRAALTEAESHLLPGSWQAQVIAYGLPRCAPQQTDSLPGHEHHYWARLQAADVTTCMALHWRHVPERARQTAAPVGLHASGLAVRQHAIAGLVTTGHTQTEARARVDAALRRHPGMTSLEELMRAIYQPDQEWEHHA